MKVLENVTMVAVAGVRIPETIEALKISSKDIKFGAVKLFTHEEVKVEGVEVINIEELDYENYNRFIVFELYKHVDTEFILIIQDDGFIVNPDQWRDEFLLYDYIGAPFPIPNDNDNISYRDPFSNLIRVGNGGFSLRSKKILKLSSDLGLEWKSYYGYFNEDGFLSVHNRHLFVENGCKFAPLEVAKYFSHEANIPEISGIVPFGFHGKNNILKYKKR